MTLRPRRSVLLPRGPVRRSRAMHDLALHEIGSAIIRGDYPVGSLLPSKEQLMAQLDVSHTTIREALQTLAAKGMIAARARVGTRVLDEMHWNMFDADVLGWRLDAGMPRWLLGMLLEIRQSIEPLAAALAATHRSKADLDHLRGLLERMRAGLDGGDDLVDADVAFHKSILGMSGNPFMASLAALTSTALEASLQMSAPAEDRTLAELVYRQHNAIVDAIARRRPEAASDAMMVVIRQGWANVHGLRPRAIAQVRLLTFPSDEEAG